MYIVQSGTIACQAILFVC